METTTPQRKLYQGNYRTELENETTQNDEPTNLDGENSNTSNTDPALTPEESSWKKRYGDLRSHSNTITERLKLLERQLQDTQKEQGFKYPSTEAELIAFEQRYPDVFRHIRSIAMKQLLTERDTLSQETKRTEEELDNIKRELGHKRIIQAHPDFEELNLSEKFHVWAQSQPTQIQDWLFSSSDPNLCIKAIDLYKAENNYRKPRQSTGADVAINSRSSVKMADDSGKRIWKASEIQKMHPKDFEKYESELEAARREGRIDMAA